MSAHSYRITMVTKINQHSNLSAPNKIIGRKNIQYTMAYARDTASGEKFQRVLNNAQKELSNLGPEQKPFLSNLSEANPGFKPKALVLPYVIARS